MKGRQRHAPLSAGVAFSYELFGSVDIKEEELLNFTGENGPRRNSEITEFLRNRSFATGRENVSRQASYLQFQQAVEVGNGAVEESGGWNNSFVSLEDAAQHVWFISQHSGGAMPFARNFTTADRFLKYAEEHSLFSTEPQEVEAAAPNEPPTAAKWLDIQTTNNALITELLTQFPVSEETLNNCHYLDGMDALSAHSALGYFFFNLMCTPIVPEEETSRSRQTKSVMQRSLEAAMEDKPRSSVPAAVPVAIIVFPQWIITVHEKPFHELGDLLKFLQINCSDHGSGATRRRRRQIMTTPFIFSSFFQVVVGHQLDTVSLTTALDRMGDYVFKVEEDAKQREEVLTRITNVRRIFAECAAELTRREHIVSILLQPHMMNSFLTQERVVCQQLESARAHLLRLSKDVGDSRDTVVVTNWYHNATRTWKIICRGNKATRQMLLLMEIMNIIYPVVAFQTLYTMNVPVPFDSGGDPPVENPNAFFVVMGIILLYLLLCTRAGYALLKRRRWSTRLLAE
ncbi:hypothetical protein MOQ_008561 [Trypanosoma cruzi marinkellei]|uniref:Uncharacterized protein n=1 Tax=Trypanosoma cruzi marinkellei TaxID=85056 RepID=K2MZB2_TRYCR|nr:hypothetical protein MOQ_008561 [Trypanosoma cruzi marinkellei]